MNGDTPPVRDILVGVWNVNTGGMLAQLSLMPNGNYMNVLAGGMQWHSGTWAVSDNPSGGHALVFAIANAFPKEYVGPLGSSPIMWPTSETWYLTSVQPERVEIYGGFMVRTQPGAVDPSAFMSANAMYDPNAELAREMQQVTDAAGKAVGKLKQIFSGFKKR